MLRVPGRFQTTLSSNVYDAVVIGGGHNGLTAAAYLGKAGKKVAVLERRHVLGGAAVTEEIIPGFKFSRASYLLSLLRPQIVKDLELHKHGLKVFLRNPTSFTPIAGTKNYLLLSNNTRQNKKQIAKFSTKDAELYPEYEKWMEQTARSIDPLLDSSPVDVHKLLTGSLSNRLSALGGLASLSRTGLCLGRDLPAFYEFITAPASKWYSTMSGGMTMQSHNVIAPWFESEPLKATLATDAVIGAMLSPQLPGSGYVLLHHVMGELNGVRNAWGYAEGGMGSVSMAIARAAKSYGAVLKTNSPVSEILVGDGKVEGVVLEDGSELRAKVVLSNATPHVTFNDLMPQGVLPETFQRAVASIDYTSPVTKINVALSGLPDFTALPNPPGQKPAPHHQCTIHLNCENSELIHRAYLDAQEGMYSERPFIEFCIPSSVDSTLAPPDCHVISMFTQYTPYNLVDGGWTDESREAYAERVFDTVEAYAPGFRKLIVGKEVLTPPDLERIFGLTGGNIFHGSMSLDQLYLARPTHFNPTYSTPVEGLYLCGSGAHPGGGVMGSPGRLAALTALDNMK